MKEAVVGQNSNGERLENHSLINIDKEGMQRISSYRDLAKMFYERLNHQYFIDCFLSYGKTEFDGEVYEEFIKKAQGTYCLYIKIAEELQEGRVVSIYPRNNGSSVGFEMGSPRGKDDVLINPALNSGQTKRFCQTAFPSGTHVPSREAQQILGILYSGKTVELNFCKKS